MPETFGKMLRRLRRAKTATVVWPSGDNMISKTGPMSQNELARRSSVDAALIHRMERDATHPSRATITAVAEALELDDADTARLLIAAGYWPWPGATDDERDALILAAGVRVRTVSAEPAFIRRRTG